MKQTSKWPAIDPVFKGRVVDYFSKCNKMGRPLRSEHIKTDIDMVNYPRPKGRVLATAYLLMVT